MIEHKKDICLLFTCEHAGNMVPHEFAYLFAEHPDVLQTHLGYDIGALELFQALADYFAAPRFYSTTTRLLVELNRSIDSANLFSMLTRSLGVAEKQAIMDAYYFPYRHQVESQIAQLLAKQKTVLHLSIHSFTPELQGKVRRADIGLLYDSRYVQEAQTAVLWQRILQRAHPEYVVRRNYPYLGRSDGFTTYLRQKFVGQTYMGIEVEVNQKYPRTCPEKWESFKHSIISSVTSLLKAL